MYRFDNFVFDHLNLLLYDKDTNPDAVDAAIKLHPGKHLQGHQHAASHMASYDCKNMSMNKIALNSFGICLTYKCNLRCVYCSYSSGNSNEHEIGQDCINAFILEMLKKRAIKKLLSKDLEPLVIYFTGGGEPTFNWKLFADTVLFVKNQCLLNHVPVRLGLTTNGILTAEQIDFISLHIEIIMVSYDGLPEIQNRNRPHSCNGASSSVVEKSIHELAKKASFPITVRTTVWQEDSGLLEDMYNHISSIASSCGSLLWSVQPAHFDGRAAASENELGGSGYKHFLEQYVRLVDTIRAKDEQSQLIEMSTPFYCDSTSGMFCGAHTLCNPWLLPDGTIVTCMESIEHQIVVGHVTSGKVSFVDTYNDYLLAVSQDKFNSCKDCIAYHFCKGGCPVWHLRNTGQSLSPECYAQIDFWKYVLQALVDKKYSFGWTLCKLDLPSSFDNEIFTLENENE